MSDPVNGKPNKHHFVPAFYTKRWSGPDRLICQFSRPYGDVVKPKRLHPNGTGWTQNLYSLRGFPPDHAQIIEEGFFRVTDTQADLALQRLETKGPAGEWKTEIRSAWSRFMISMLIRAPVEIDLLRQQWAAYVAATDEVAEREYAKIRRSNDPVTFNEYLLQMPAAEIDKHLFEMFMPMIDNKKIGKILNGMYWSVANTANATFDFLTSDRPVVRSALTDKFAYWAIPIGPRKLFLAANTIETMKNIHAAKVDDLVREINLKVVRQAEKYVFGRNDWRLDFVTRHMGKERPPPMLRIRPREMYERVGHLAGDLHDQK